MKIINLTPHAIKLPNVTIEPSGYVARCEEVTECVGDIDGIETVTKKYGNVQGLPGKEQGTIYIVSMLVRQALSYREDLFSPGDLVRDNEGNITGCLNLVTNMVFR